MATDGASVAAAAVAAVAVVVVAVVNAVAVAVVVSALLVSRCLVSSSARHSVAASVRNTIQKQNYYDTMFLRDLTPTPLSFHLWSGHPHVDTNPNPT